MKRFLLITMTIIMSTLMLATTAFATDDSIRIVFDEEKIKIIAQHECSALLNITIQIGDKQEEISKMVELQEKITTTLSVEDLVFEEFSDFYTAAEVKIINATIDNTGKVKRQEIVSKMFVVALILLAVAFVGGIIIESVNLKNAPFALFILGIVLAIIFIGYVVWTV